MTLRLPVRNARKKKKKEKRYTRMHIDTYIYVASLYHFNTKRNMFPTHFISIPEIFAHGRFDLIF